MSVQNTLDSVKPEEVAEINQKFGVRFEHMDDVQKEYYILGLRHGKAIADKFIPRRGCLERN
jgi:hypothetical protein